MFLLSTSSMIFMGPAVYFVDQTLSTLSISTAPLSDISRGTTFLFFASQFQKLGASLSLGPYNWRKEIILGPLEVIQYLSGELPNNRTMKMAINDDDI